MSTASVPNFHDDDGAKACCPCGLWKSQSPASLDSSARQFKRDVLARVRSAADRDDNILLAVDHIGHGRAALRRGHPHRAHLAYRSRLSYARSIAPRGRPGGEVTCGSPTTTSVFVTKSPTLPAWPVFGMSRPFRSGIIADRVRCVTMRNLEPDRFRC